MFCHAILITRGSSESMVASTTQHELVIELRLHTAWATCDPTTEIKMAVTEQPAHHVDFERQ